jgi:hypothetical protein
MDGLKIALLSSLALQVHISYITKADAGKGGEE